MASSSGTKPAIAAAVVTNWLREEIARTLGVAVERVNPLARLQSLGLDSARVTKLIADLAKWLERPLQVTVAWKFPTIDALARHVASETSQDRSGEHPSSVASHAAAAPAVDEPIAIVGIGCRFGGGVNSPNAYWRLLRDGVDAISEVPKERWDIDSYFDADIRASGKMTTRRGGFVDHVDRFDAAFFGISPREATEIDPQQRLMMELSWEALEDASIAPDSLRGSRTGVFFGAMWSDYARLASGDVEQIVQHTATGQDTSIVSARVSYTLGLEGPSLVVNTACSSSLVAVHLACQSLRNGESTQALAGGVNLILAPHMTVAMSKFGAMAPDGRCKAFDARANGYVRGEGGGVVVLKPLSRALADGDTIYCVLLGSAANNDGFSNGLPAPNPAAQEGVLRDAYARAGVDPTKVQYVETHGTGTFLGDPIEAGALGLVLGENRGPGQALRIGSAKTNLGHTEAAAGIAGLIKVALSIKHRALPPSLHFESPNPHIPFQALNVEVQRELSAWPSEGEPLVAGVSSFGFGGTNCHVVLGSAPTNTTRAIPMSAATPAELKQRIFELMSAAADLEEQEGLDELCLTALRALGEGAYRAAVVADSPATLLDRLAAQLRGSGAHKTLPKSAPTRRPRLVFVCSGHGPQWLGMGRTLLQSEPVFRATISECDRLVRALTGFSVIDELIADEKRSRLHRVDVVQPLLCSMQIAVGTLWRSWGVEPDALIGHSFGEIAACHLAGILSLDDAMRVVCDRSRLALEESGRGGMIVVPLSADEALEAVAVCAGSLTVAAYNSPTSTVLSGDAALIEAALHHLQARGVDAARVNIGYASHCARMDALEPELVASLRGIEPRRGRVRVISTVTGDELSGPECGAHYWGRNLRQPVRFMQAVEKLLSEDGATTILELSPHPVLLRSVAQIARNVAQNVAQNVARGVTQSETSATTLVASLRRDEDERTALLDALRELYVQGQPVRWNDVYRIEPAAPPRGATLVLPLSARSREALSELARSHQRLLAESSASAHDIAFTASVRRSHHEHRLAVVGSTREELSAALEAAQNEVAGAEAELSTDIRSERGVVFVFSGQGSQWFGMGCELFEHEPTFREAVEHCDVLFRRHASWSLVDELTAPAERSRMMEPEVAQPVLFAVQIGLAELWRSWGIVPAAVIGQSLGEIAAACVAGALSLEDAIAVVYHRGRVTQGAKGRGRMASVEASPEQAALAIEGYEDRVAIAAINDPGSVLLCGDAEALEAVLATLARSGVSTRMMPPYCFASHSPQMDPFVGELRASLATLSPKRPVLPMISTVTGALISEDPLDATYWAKNLRHTVQLAAALDTAISQGYRTFLEISPHPAARANIRECLAQREVPGVAVASLRREREERRTLLESLAALYTQGHTVAWSRLFPTAGQCVALPAYPWQRKRYWIESGRRARRDAVRQGRGAHPLLGARVPIAVPGARVWEQSIGTSRLPYLADHCVHSEVIFPATGFIEVAMAAGAEISGSTEVSLESMKFERLLPIPVDGAQTVQVVVTEIGPGRADVQVFARLESTESTPSRTSNDEWIRHATAKLSWTGPFAAGGRDDERRLPAAAIQRCATTQARDEVYTHLLERGLGYGSIFQGIEQFWFGNPNDLEAIGRICVPETIGDDPLYRLHPALLDACLQTAVLVFRNAGTIVPVGIERVVQHRRVGRAVWAHVRRGERPLTADLVLTDDDGLLLAELTGIRLQRIASREREADDGWLHSLVWQRKEVAPVPAKPRTQGAWLLFCDRSGTGAALASLLRDRGDSCVQVVAGDCYAQLAPDLFQVRAAQRGDIDAVMRNAFGDARACLGAVHLFSLDARASRDTTLATLQEDQETGCLSALAVTQALVGRGDRDTARLWLVTQGAQAVVAGDRAPEDPATLSQSPLWGFGRVLSLEHPELSCTRVDLSAAPDENHTRRLFDELTANDREDQIALRPEGRYVIRLAQAALEEESATVSLDPERGGTVRGDATYLITGGLGGLGVALARWMVELGARHVVLVSRRAASERTRAEIRAMEEAGARVLALQADVTKPGEVSALMAAIDGDDRLPPLRGVVHAAGVVEDRTVSNLSAELFWEAFAPKALGAWNLHELTRGRPLDFFVLYSSTASLLGSPGQGNYAAGNAFLDALAHHRHALGLPGLSINWGAFSEIGEATHEHRGARLAHRGLGSITPVEAEARLPKLLATKAAQIGVMQFDPRRWLEFYPSVARSPFWSDLVREHDRARTTVAAKDTSLLETLRSADEAVRTRAMTEFLSAQVAQVLRLDGQRLDRTTPFASVGMDSLMSLELKQRLESSLGLKLSSALVFTYPTLATLSEHLLGRIALEPRGEQPTTAPKRAAVAPEPAKAAVEAKALSALPANAVAPEPAKAAVEAKALSALPVNAVAPEPAKAAVEAKALSALPANAVAPSRKERLGIEPIAIIGTACRIPGGGDTPGAFWELLRGGVDAVTDVPAERWDWSHCLSDDGSTFDRRGARWGAFLKGVDQFDAPFFGISAREASTLDPQQRLVLEVSWEALEHAGQVPEQLVGTRTGVYLGMMHDDYKQLCESADPEGRDVYRATGSGHSFAAGRLSYSLGLQGPSLSVDTACSSSLVAIHLACQSLRSGECELALAGGVSLMLAPFITDALTAVGALSPEGRCKAFDAQANGFVRGEGCAILVLKRLSDAQADGDTILAVIRGSAVNQDGRSSGLTAPNVLSQKAMLRLALENARVSPSDVTYIETHGTGTPLGDPIEFEALADVFGAPREDGSTCALGALKTNVGHLEGAAGVAGVLKVVLALQNEAIPANLHFTQLNPRMSIDGTPLVVPTEMQPWARGTKPRIAGVSGFGMSGTNAHIVLQEAPRAAEPKVAAASNADESLYLLPLSARSPEALAALAASYQRFLTEGAAGESVRDIAYTASVRRSHHDHRLAVVGRTREELADALRDAAEADVLSLPRVANSGAGARDVVFVFSGQGSQWPGMGRELLRDEPVFREAVERCDALLRRHVSWSLVDELTAPPERSRMLRPEIAQPALFAVQFGLSELWRSWGVRPAAVIGQSIGEVAAACIAGALSLEDAILIVYHRGRLTQTAMGLGKMASVEASAEQAKRALEGYEGKVAIASINDPGSVVLSGDGEALDEVLASLARRDVRGRVLKVDYASHSPQMDPLLDELASVLTAIKPKSANVPMVSTVTRALVQTDQLDAAYWAKNLRETVHLAGALDVAITEGYRTFLEVGPHPVALASIRECLSHRGVHGAVVSSLRRESDERRVLLDSVAALYAEGHAVSWKNFFPSAGRCVSLPTYPWQRARYWVEADIDADYAERRRVSVRHAGSVRAANDAITANDARSGLDPEGWLHAIEWQRKDLAPTPQKASAKGAWLLFCDRSGTGAALAARLGERGDACVRVVAGERYARLGPDLFEIRLARPDDIDAVLRDAFGASGTLCRGVVHLFSLDASDARGTTAETFTADQQLGCLSALSLTQALVRLGARDAPRLWFVTRGAQRVTTAEGASECSAAAPAVSQAPLWGFGRVVAIEHPELACTRVDLGADPEIDQTLALVEELESGDREDQIALRPDGRYVARLARSSANVAENASASLSADRTYLITGGLGGLGLSLARWMVERGARHLALVGRSAPSDTARSAILSMEQAGARVLAVQADVAKRADVTSLLAQIDEQLPPLGGIVHAAAVLADRTVQQLDAELFWKALAPKALGAWNLHELTREMSLDFFVLYSSAASLLGSPGQANYAAGNAFLDALAHHRRALGLPALSINWGAFTDAGLAAAQENRGARLAYRGLEGFTTAQAEAMLVKLLPTNATQIGVMPFDVRRWLEFYPSADGLPYWSSLLCDQAGAPLATSRRDTRLLDALENAEPAERQPVLAAYLSNLVVRSLRLNPSRLEPTTPLGSVGMDSLMSLELKHRIESSLGLKLPAALLYTYANIAALSEHLLERLELAPQRTLGPPPPSTPEGEPPAPPDSSVRARAIDALCEADIEKMLAEKLARIKQRRTA